MLPDTERPLVTLLVCWMWEPRTGWSPHALLEHPPLFLPLLLLCLPCHLAFYLEVCRMQAIRSGNVGHVSPG